MIELLIFYAGFILGVVFIWLPMRDKIGFREIIEKSDEFFDSSREIK